MSVLRDNRLHYDVFKSRLKRFVWIFFGIYMKHCLNAYYVRQRRVILCTLLTLCVVYNTIDSLSLASDSKMMNFHLISSLLFLSFLFFFCRSFFFAFFLFSSSVFLDKFIVKYMQKCDKTLLQNRKFIQNTNSEERKIHQNKLTTTTKVMYWLEDNNNYGICVHENVFHSFVSWFVFASHQISLIIERIAIDFFELEWHRMKNKLPTSVQLWFPFCVICFRNYLFVFLFCFSTKL